jgi:hypothetical protein
VATSLLRAGASRTHIRRYLGQVSEKMAEHYVHLAQSDLEDVLQQVWVAGPGRAIDGLEKALAGLGLLEDVLALDMRKPQDYFHRVWSTAFRAADLAAHDEDEDRPAREHRSRTGRPPSRNRGGPQARP